ncbi:hypothetical protein HDU76_002779 [Blyttiomyces sp. JEL0837]|nr:hypothetical protein HDU76_002779 [Blyttiomyces sp. JEL0837]
MIIGNLITVSQFSREVLMDEFSGKVGRQVSVIVNDEEDVWFFDSMKRVSTVGVRDTGAGEEAASLPTYSTKIGHRIAKTVVENSVTEKTRSELPTISSTLKTDILETFFPYLHKNRHNKHSKIHPTTTTTSPSSSTNQLYITSKPTIKNTTSPSSPPPSKKPTLTLFLEKIGYQTPYFEHHQTFNTWKYTTFLTSAKYQMIGLFVDAFLGPFIDSLSYCRGEQVYQPYIICVESVERTVGFYLRIFGLAGIPLGTVILLLILTGWSGEGDGRRFALEAVVRKVTHVSLFLQFSIFSVIIYLSNPSRDTAWRIFLTSQVKWLNAFFTLSTMDVVWLTKMTDLIMVATFVILIRVPAQVGYVLSVVIIRVFGALYLAKFVKDERRLFLLEKRLIKEATSQMGLGQSKYTFGLGSSTMTT